MLEFVASKRALGKWRDVTGNIQVREWNPDGLVYIIVMPTYSCRVIDCLNE